MAGRNPLKSACGQVPDYPGPLARAQKWLLSPGHEAGESFGLPNPAACGTGVQNTDRAHI